MEADRPHEPNSRRERFAAMLRGGSRSVNLAVAVALGLAIGFSAGWNFTVVALLVLAALSNANARLLLASSLAGALLAWLAAPVTSGIGGFIFDETQFGTWVGMLGDGPLAAMFDLDRFCLVGGLLLAFLLAGPLGRAAWQVGEARRVDEESPPPRRREGLFRPQAWLAVSAVLLLGGALPWWIGTRQLERRILTLLSDFNGAEVNVVRIHLEPWTGHLELDGLQIPDPANLERDRLRIARVRAELRGGPLLRGRLEIEHLHLTGIDRDVARHKAATAVTARIPQIRFSPAPLALPVDPSQELELHDYIRGWDQFASRISLLGQLLNTLERIGSLEPDRPERASSATLFSSTARAARSNLGSPRPALWIEQTVAEDFGESWGLGRKPLLELAQLSTNPKLAKSPPSLKIVLPDMSAEVHSTLDFLSPGQRHQVQMQAVDLPLASLVEQSSGGSRIAVEDGQASISGQGWMDDARFDLNLQIQISALKARVQGAEPAAGITPAAWNRGLEKLGGLRVELTCGGRWTSPRLHVQGRDLVNQFKHQLRSAGDHNLLASIEEQLAASAVPVTTAVVVTDAVELPHPLPNPDPPAANQAAVPNYLGVERLPQPAPAAVLDPEPYVAVQNAPPQSVARSVEASPVPTAVVSDTAPSPPASASLTAAAAAALQMTTTKTELAPARPAEPLAMSAVVDDEAAAQPQPLDARVQTRPTVATRTGLTTPAPLAPAEASSGVVTVSDELFGPPPLAVPAVGQDAATPAPAAAPVWQPPVSASTPSYRSPPPPQASYVAPATPAVQSYVAPPTAATPATPNYAATTTTPAAADNMRRPAKISISPAATPQVSRYTGPSPVEPPPSNAAAVSPATTSYGSSRSTSREMPGPINLQLGSDDEAPRVSPATTPRIASKRVPTQRRTVLTPKETLEKTPLAGPNFFQQSAAPSSKQPPPATATDANDVNAAAANSPAAQKPPWYKRFW